MTPISLIRSGCCARAMAGQATPLTPISLMKSRRLIASPEARDKALYQLKVAHCKGGRVGSDVRFGSKAGILASQERAVLADWQCARLDSSRLANVDILWRANTAWKRSAARDESIPHLPSQQA